VLLYDVSIMVVLQQEPVLGSLLIATHFWSMFYLSHPIVMQGDGAQYIAFTKVDNKCHRLS
jgi:hypothetical protein